MVVIVKTDSGEVKSKAKSLGFELFEDLGEVQLATIRDKEDEIDAIDLAGDKPLLVEFPDQRIIPLENLIAALKGKTKILVRVDSAAEAKTALETLELGADGVVFCTESEDELGRMVDIFPLKVSLEEAEITKVKELGMGRRACIDLSDLMGEGEGFLVGSSSQGMLLVQAEVMHNPFVSPRPFRVNAGAISLYLLTGSRTRYIEELEAGEEALIVDRGGSTRLGDVVRSKIELRPLLLIEAKSDGRVAKAVLQNGETIRLVTPKGSKPVTEIKPGDKVIAHFEEGGRHFGTLVKEQVIEK
jgi:3-dehydroquinate synthase II